MTQRISVRIRLIQTDKTLLIRRADGRESILGKYELPGGRIKPGEQPEDAARRFLLDQLGIKDVTLRLNDAMTYQDDDLSAQYAIIVYLVPVGKGKRIISLGEHYDKYVWYSPGKVDQSMMTDVSRLVLGAMTALPLEGEAELESGSKDGAFVYTDGGSRGNPGPSAAGYVIIKEGEIVDQGGEYIGITTNNQAEYHGVKLGLEAALRLGIPEVEVRVDENGDKLDISADNLFQVIANIPEDSLAKLPNGKKESIFDWIFKSASEVARSIADNIEATKKKPSSVTSGKKNTVA
jgi:ADP-ribose pyrophosphatase YjhB (NUDIX family)